MGIPRLTSTWGERMGNGLLLRLIAALALCARSLDAQVINPDLERPLGTYRALLRAACRTLAPLYREGVVRLGSVFNPLADGGGDSGGDGSDTGGDSTDSGSTDSGSTDSTGPGDN